MRQAPSTPFSRFTFVEYHMGVDARIVVYAKDQTSAEDACAAGFEKMSQLDWIMSDYRPKSELMQLCDKAGGPAVHVSPDLFKILKYSVEVSRWSQGTFDVTVGPLVRLWRQARKTGVLPKQSAIQAALKLVGWRHIHLDAARQSVRLDLKGMQLDLGGIGKGYADDEVQKVLKQHGIESALVEMGGDIVVSGPPPDKTGWLVQVPNAVQPKSGTADISNCAISTSGDTEQFVVIGGVKYSHVIDPHTGIALDHGVQATIICPNGLESDALSLPLTVLDEKGRAALLKHYPGVKTFIRVIPFGSG